MKLYKYCAYNDYHENNYNQGMMMSQAWYPDYVFKSKGEKSRDMTPSSALFGKQVPWAIGIGLYFITSVILWWTADVNLESGRREDKFNFESGILCLINVCRCVVTVIRTFRSRYWFPFSVGSAGIRTSICHDHGQYEHHIFQRHSNTGLIFSLVSSLNNL